jgi:hypothetical protein
MSASQSTRKTIPTKPHSVPANTQHKPSHTNSGPKFGIELLDTAICKSARAISPFAEPNSASSDLLHIPTPWHNCVFKFTDSPIIYVAKSKIVRDALSEGLFAGGWIEGRSGTGGYFEIRRTEPGKREDTSMSVGAANMETRSTKLWMLPLKAGAWGLYLLKLGAVSLGAEIYLSTTRWMAAWFH